MATPLLKTKLYIPQLRPDLVPRPRLIEQLNAGLHRKLTLVSAPAGFGKTTLLSHWISDFGFGISDSSAALGTSVRLKKPSDIPGVKSPQPAIRNRVAWLSLDEGDNDPLRFLTYLVAALQTIEAGIGAGLLGALQSPGFANANTPPPAEIVLTSLIPKRANIASSPRRTSSTAIACAMPCPTFISSCPSAFHLTWTRLCSTTFRWP